MKGGRIGNNDGLGPVLAQRFAHIRLDRVAGQFVIWKCGPVRAEQDNIRLPQRREVAQMTATDGTQSGNQDFCHVCPVAWHYTVLSCRGLNWPIVQMIQVIAKSNISSFAYSRIRHGQA